MIVPHSDTTETKIFELYAHTALGRRLLPTAWVLDSGRCSCTMREKSGEESTKLCLQGNKVGKHPLITEWQRRATDDWDEVRGWHEHWPHANWGWLQDKTFALDVDPGRGGLESLTQWEDEAGGPPPTLTQRTRSDGYHFIYRQPESGMKVQGDILPGIEVRGIGSYIMIQPSVGWTLVDPSRVVEDADELVLGLIEKHGLWLDDGVTGKKIPGATGDTSEQLPATEWFMSNGLGGFSGSRNRDAYRLAWRLLRLGDVNPHTYTTQRIAGIMKTCWLATDQGDSPFDWDECLGALRSAWNRKTRQDKQDREREYSIAVKLTVRVR